MTRNNGLLTVLIPVLAYFIFFSATLRRGQHWGGDFAMYIHHAKNIAEGIPYAQTGYIYNPARPIAPKVYPPVFPLLLTPIYKIFGLDLMPMKLEILVFFELFLFLCLLNFKEELPPTLAFPSRLRGRPRAVVALITTPVECKGSHWAITRRNVGDYYTRLPWDP